jgi:hypothetical protein
MAYIYTLYRNNIPFYIGKTSNDPQKRERDHRYKYGNDIVLEVLDKVKIDEWKFWESYWIEQFKVWGFNLLNQNEGGGGPQNHNINVRNKISNSRKNKCLVPVLQYDLKGNLIKEYPSVNAANTEIANKFVASSIGMCLKGKLHTAYGFIWRYKNNDNRDMYIPLHKNSKIVEQYNKEGIFIQEYPSYIFAKETTGIDMQNVLIDKAKTAGGFVWKYKNNLI